MFIDKQKLTNFILSLSTHEQETLSKQIKAMLLAFSINPDIREESFAELFEKYPQIKVK